MSIINRTAGLVCLFMAATAPATQAGLVMKSVVSSDGKDKDSDSQNARMTISVQDKGMRMDYVESNNPQFKKGDCVITADGGQTFFIVQAQDKTYMPFDTAMAGGVMSMMNLKASDTKSELLLDEAGPKILGYPTRHTKVLLSYIMEMNFMGMKQKNQISQEMETWATTQIDASPFEAWAKNMARSMGNKEIDELMKMSMKHAKGVPLKAISAITTTEKGGKKTTKTTVTEVIEIKEQPLSLKLFQIPEGYKNLMEDMPKADESGSDGSSSSEQGDAPRPRGKGPSLSDMFKMAR